ncbi:hypothetical protein [Bacillus sp. JJ1562]|uniref:hypothetical protein n=1 Tax=Bacillus sp. JJ1562 TaxID=3122960 RepID=UPI0030014EF8
MSDFVNNIAGAENKIVDRYVHYFEKGYGYSGSNLLFKDGTTFVSVDNFGKVDIGIDENSKDDNFFCKPSRLELKGKFVKFVYTIVSSHRGEYGCAYVKFTDGSSAFFQLWGDEIEEETIDDIDINGDHEMTFIELVLGVSEIKFVKQDLFEKTLKLILSDAYCDEMAVYVKISSSQLDLDNSSKINSINSFMIYEKGHGFQIIESDISADGFECWLIEKINEFMKYNLID